MQCLPNQVDGQAFLQMQVRAVQLHIQLGRRDGQVLTDFLRRERQPLQLSRLCEVAVGLKAPPVKLVTLIARSSISCLKWLQVQYN